MLEKSGARKRLEGAEKLDFLVWLADQVKGSIEEGRKMQLKCGELADFLRREGVCRDVAEVDAKTAVIGLLALRRREITRLDYNCTSSLASGDESFEVALALMPLSKVTDCFEGAVVPWSNHSSGRSDSPAASPATEALPGQIPSPRGAPSPVQKEESPDIPSAIAGSQHLTKAQVSSGRLDASSRDSPSRKHAPAFGSPLLPPGVPPPPTFPSPFPQDASKAELIPDAPSTKAKASSGGRGGCSLQ